MSRSVSIHAGTGIAAPAAESSSRLSRRTLFAGAGTVGALATAAALVPAVRDVAPATDLAKEPPERGGGYALSEHVKRYYRTTRL
ncbi:MAG: hypothetical protein NVS2B4_11710 [Ramlibacter sp.]